MELMVSVTAYCASGSCWWQQTTYRYFISSGSQELFFASPLLQNLSYFSFHKSSVDVLLIFFLIWNIHLFKATVCFPVGLTGNGMTYVMWHSLVGMFLFEAQAVLLVRHLCWSLIRVKASWPWHKHSSVLFLQEVAFVINQSHFNSCLADLCMFSSLLCSFRFSIFTTFSTRYVCSFRFR